MVILTGDRAGGFDVEVRFWLPRDIIADLERRHGQPYRMWAQQGLIILTDGNTIDEDFIESEIIKLSREPQPQHAPDRPLPGPAAWGLAP